MQHTSANPLAKHFRQPKIYIRLPSGGNWYNNGLVKTESGEYPVFAMTARDELKYKTPDALLNGQATVDVIQSCVPNITNGWDIPNIDLDALLLAIRIATFGEKLEITQSIKLLNENNEYVTEERAFDADLRVSLDAIMSESYVNIIQCGDFVIETKPLNYRNATDVSMKTFEEQRIFFLIKNDKMSETDKLAKIQESFNTLTNMTIDLVKRSVVSVKYKDEDAVTNPTHISEFLDNADKDVYYAVVKHVEAQRSNFIIRPMTAKLSPEDVARGAPETMQIQILLDQTNFFGKGS